MNESPVAFPKAIKNPVEMQGMKRANVRVQLLIYSNIISVARIF